MPYQEHNEHTPVLLQHVLEWLNPARGERYLDATAGYGGHAQAMLELTAAPTAATLVDRDAYALTTLAPLAQTGVRLIHGDFLSAARSLQAEGKQFDIILADLGISSPHIDNASRGFAFALEGPLDMRMDQRQSLDAAEIVNTYPVDELRRIIRTYGEEPLATRVAAAIVAARPVQTTRQLADIVRLALPKGKHKTHPATKTFQALRIAVNDELEQVRQAIPLWVELLAPGGRLGIISFHSLEDRLVKQAFSELGGNRYDAPLTILTKRPVIADEQELVFNPRSRSAKLRVAVKK